MNFEDGLRLVSKRALAMQKACEAVPSTMAAVLALPDEKVEEICAATEGVVVPANYNCPGQLVISGEIPAVRCCMRSGSPSSGSQTCSAPAGRRCIPLSTYGTCPRRTRQSHSRNSVFKTGMPCLPKRIHHCRYRSGRNKEESHRTTHRTGEVDPERTQYGGRWRYGVRRSRSRQGASGIGQKNRTLGRSILRRSGITNSDTL